jgi:hypothetical protein
LVRASYSIRNSGFCLGNPCARHSRPADSCTHRGTNG